MGIRSLVAEMRARRQGRAGLERSELSTAARDIVGRIGWMTSRGWEEMARGKDAYVKSLDPRIPPSTFVSQRDRTRHNIPIPLPERVLEDHRKERRPDDPSTTG